jgi:hypothetical protein
MMNAFARANAENNALLSSWLIQKGCALFLLLTLIMPNIFSQTKLGGTVGPSDPNAYFELGDATTGSKGLLLPRVNLSLTTSPSPLSANVKGMVVYNKNIAGNGATGVTEGIYYNDGTLWIKLIDAISLPQAALTKADNGLSVNNGSVQLGGTLRQSTTVTTSATNTLTINGLQTGAPTDSLIATDTSGALRKISFDELIQNLNATSGLTYNAASRTLTLGGTLQQPTTLNTSAINTLSIKGLADGTIDDHILVADTLTGVMKKLPASALIPVRKTETLTANDGETTFPTPFAISSLDKLQVFRNGVEVNFLASIGSKNITIDFSKFADDKINACFAGDEIKIYQWK